jgi:medium-chain acyl-[acyl-carrier-protein] hydrolase
MLATEEKTTKETFKIRYSELDCTMTLKPVALFQFLQDVASDNAERLGFGYSYIIKNRLAWFLLKYRLEFTDYPENISSIEIETNPRGYNKLFAFRDFTIKDGNKTIGRVASTWGLINLDTKAMVPISQVLENSPYMNQFVKNDSDLSYQKIKQLDRVDFEASFKVRFDELDVNQHANNANYISWAIEPLDFEFRKANKIKTIDMIFKKELKYGETILSQAELIDSKSYHIVKNLNTNDELCTVCIQWEKK